MATNICLFGDSITWGSGDASLGGWADRLKAYYEGEPDADVRIYNLGVPSDTTDDILARFVREAQARRATHAVFAIGINDAKMIEGGAEEAISLEDFRSNMLQIIEDAAALDMQIAFLGLTRVDETKTQPILWRPDIHYTNDRIALFDNSIKELCEDKELPYLTLSGVLEEEDMPDGLHPNTVGHEKLVTTIAPFLQARFAL